MTTGFSEPEDMSLWNCMVLNGIFMFLFNEESRKCSVPIVQNYNKNQFCAHKQNRNKPFVNYELAAAAKVNNHYLFHLRNWVMVMDWNIWKRTTYLYSHCLFYWVLPNQIEMKLPEIAWVVQTLSFNEDKAELFIEQPSVFFRNSSIFFLWLLCEFW